jgi:hypothetical protein
MVATDQFDQLDGLSTEELREKAFALARKRMDMKFFWHLVRILPHADDMEQLDASMGSIGASVEDAVDLWREFTGHDYGSHEPTIRAAFIDYLLTHRS